MDTNHEHETLSNSEALDNAYAELKNLLPKEHEFVTSECLDDADIIESMDIYFDLGMGAAGATFLFALHENYFKDEQEMKAISALLDDAMRCQDDIDNPLCIDIRDNPEKFGIPAERHGSLAKSLSWLIANVENVADPRARVIEKSKIAAKIAINAVNRLRDRMELAKLRKSRVVIN
jgi:hypothetical protein